ncbi:MAG: hypothetical protein HYY16_08005 [Planctomycetes bacterium]|nr:hypothetical protein [Planctomycetota bacterium]
MRAFLVLMAAVPFVIPGCAGGPSPEELEQKRKAELEQLQLELDRKINDLDKKITDLEKRYASVMQMEQRAKNALEEVQKMTKVNEVVAEFLQHQKELLVDQGQTVKLLLEKFQQK